MSVHDGSRKIYVHKTNRKVKPSPWVLDLLLVHETNVDDYFTPEELKSMFWHFRNKDAWWYKFAKRFR